MFPHPAHNSTILTFPFAAGTLDSAAVCCRRRLMPSLLKSLFCPFLFWKVIEVGVRKPGAYEMERLGTGEVGYLVCGVKNVLDARVGDTITNAKERE